MRCFVMTRTFTYTALILRVKPSGESNRDLWFLCAEEGILRATVFGGPKSKLRAHAAPFHRGTLWVYHDPVRNSRKVTDFDVQSWRPGIRERYERSAAASAVADTILAAYGGGGQWQAALDMADQTLDALDAADEEICERIVLHFLWNWPEHLGLRPSARHCASCARESPPDEGLWYSPREETLLCPRCAERSGRAPNTMIPLGPASRRWLLAVQDRAPSLLVNFPLDKNTAREVKAAATAILSGALGRRLATWDMRF